MATIGFDNHVEFIGFNFFSNLNSSKLAPYDYEDSYNPFEHRVIDKPNT